MTDINGPEIIEILISEDGKTVWVNTGYECVLRACRIRKLLLNDNRKSKGKKKDGRTK